jgi:Na+-translocating ferredoxin:NAD+ oxidoreductase RnfG subunit
MGLVEIFGLVFFICISVGVFVQIVLVLQSGKIVVLLSKQTEQLTSFIVKMEVFKANYSNQEIEVKKKPTDQQRWQASQKKKEWWAKKKASEAATPETPKTSD